MKFVGGSLLWCAAIFFGIAGASRLKKRAEVFDKTVQLLERILIEIDYLSTSLPSVVHILAEEETFRCLDFIPLCVTYILGGEGFPSAWKKSISDSCLPLKKEERSKLCELANVLGSSDLSGQKRALEMYICIFRDLSLGAREGVKKYASLFVTGGVFSGCMLFVLVI